MAKKAMIKNHIFLTIRPNRILLGLGLLGFTLLPSAQAADLAFCQVVNAGKPITVPGSCGTMTQKNKFGSCKATHTLTENISGYQAALNDVGATTGKRVWTGQAVHTFSFSRGGDNSCNDKNEDRRTRWFEQIEASALDSEPDFKGFCPDATKASPRGTTFGANAVDSCEYHLPAKNCPQPQNPFVNLDGKCIKGLPDPDCDDFDSFEYYRSHNECSKRYSKLYNDCLKQAYANDCFCNSPSERYVFDTSKGTWFCKACEEGTIQDDTTGTSCTSICDKKGQPDKVLDLISGECVGCKEGFEKRGGKCRRKCTLSEDANPDTYECEKVCPEGMFPDAAKKTCQCSDPTNKVWGTNPPRSPVVSSFVGNLSYPIWNAVDGGVEYGTTDSSYSCACSTGFNSKNISQLDQIDAITDPNAMNIPYGRVGLVTASSGGVTSYTCGCPNMNETFQFVNGGYRCVPALKPGGVDASGAKVGIVLKEIPFNANMSVAAARAAVGILDGASENPNLVTAMLRESGTSGKDVSKPYRRKVWACMDGFFADSAGICQPLENSPIELANHNCSDSTPLKSSDYLTDATKKALDDAGKSFSNLTNKRLACCLGRKSADNDPAKFQCAASQASAYDSFDEYYNARGGTLDWAGVEFPNQLFLKTSDGRTIPGVYRKDGIRCTVFDKLPPSQQLRALATAVKNLRTNLKAVNPFEGIAGVTASASDQELCRVFVRTALEVECGSEQIDPAIGKATVSFPATSADYRSKDPGGSVARRCFQAASLRVHYSVDDLTDVTKTGLTAKRGLSSIGVNGEATTTIDIQRLIKDAK